MRPTFRFAELSASLERLARRELRLSERALPPGLAALDGELRGRPARLSARAYAGPWHAYARWVALRGEGLEIENLLLAPRPDLPLPVLGIDLVGLGKERAVVVADLSPMTDDPARRAAERAAVARCVKTRLGEELAVELPAWAKRWFSESALCARVTPEESGAARRAVAERVAAYIELCRAEPERPAEAQAALAERGEVARRQQAYFAAHRSEDRGLQLLRRILDPAVADRFLREVLFPERFPA